MNKPLIVLPCTAKQLHDAVYAFGIHQGLHDAKIRVVFVKTQGYYYLEFYDLEPATKGETK